MVQSNSAMTLQFRLPPFCFRAPCSHYEKLKIRVTDRMTYQTKLTENIFYILSAIALVDEIPTDTIGRLWLLDTCDC
jgi:hypothetical protein